MKIAWHATVPFPAIESTDAVFQEIAALQNNFSGTLNTLYPLGHGTYIPWRFYGLHQLLHLLRLDRTHDLHHVFCAHLWPFPVMKYWRKPVVFSLTAGLRDNERKKGEFSVNTAFVVSNQRDAQLVSDAGFAAPLIIEPGIDTLKFSRLPLPTLNKFTLMAGSAPWGKEQFVSKGVDTLLRIAKRTPQLHLIFLWRQVLYDEIIQKVQEAGLSSQVEIINRRTNVNDLLARVNATIVLAQEPSLIKAWPHSLIESLLAGRPAVVSQCVPMADYVAQKKCGVVVSNLAESCVAEAINELMANYTELYENTWKIKSEDFSLTTYASKYTALYHSVLASW
jgi:glycosyltransferase involved in cell wall biosynthesis